MDDKAPQNVLNQSFHQSHAIIIAIDVYQNITSYTGTKTIKIKFCSYKIILDLR